LPYIVFQFFSLLESKGNSFFFNHAQSNLGAYDLTVLFFKSFGQASLWGKTRSSAIWGTANAYPLRTKSDERGQERITKNMFIWIDCFQYWGNRVLRCIESTSWTLYVLLPTMSWEDTKERKKRKTATRGN